MRLPVSEWGDPSAPPVVCVHGVGGCRGSFARVAQDRWAHRFRVIAPDLRGHGDARPDPPWTFATHVADLIDTIDGLGLDQPSFVGHSLGGRLVLELAARHADRVRAAVVTEPVIELPPDVTLRRAEQERLGGTWDSLEDFVASRENTGAVDAGAYLADLRGHFDVLVDGRVRRRTCQAAVVAIFSEFATPAPPPDSITVPMMLLHAPAFGLVTPAQRAAYAPWVREVVEVPGLHAVFVTAYEETAAAVERFLADPAASPPPPSAAAR